ncbi:hypothetical protein ACFQNE_13730 [Gordonia phosphorivorans]|uniref:Uncharacterized protein n=1 Tax=Gordonia phosphorivorans TaxID=1056982 RepID=A0ABV6HD44_9ACTN
MEVLGAFILLAFLFGIFWVMFQGVGKYPGRKIGGVASDRRDPGDLRWVVAMMGGLALGTAYGELYSYADAMSGAAIGLFVGVLVLLPSQLGALAVAGINVAAGLIAVWGLGRLIAGSGGFDVLGTAYRMVLVVTLVAAFALGVLWSGHLKSFMRVGGLGLFGVVEVVGFLVSPQGSDTLNLGESPVVSAAYVLVAAGLALLVGTAVSPYVLGVLAISVAVVQWFGASVFGDAESSWIGTVAAAFGGGIAFFGSKMFGLRSRV